jgi:type I restriction enzyme S subunit
LLPKDETIDAAFLYFLLQSPGFVAWASHNVSGANLPRLDPKILEEYTFQLPAIGQQRKIAVSLRAAHRLRRMRRYALLMCDEFAPAAFLEMFGDGATATKAYPVKCLEEIVDPNRIVTYGIVQAGPHVPGGVPYIKTGDIVDGVIRVDELQCTSREIAESYRRSQVNLGDLVMSIRATVGTVAVLPKELDGANLTQGTARIAPSAEVDELFLLWQLRSSETQRWIKQQIKGTTFLEITLERLREMPIFVPPLSLQQAVADIARHHQQLRAIHVEALRQAEHFFQTLLHQAFRY